MMFKLVQHSAARRVAVAAMFGVLVMGVSACSSDSDSTEASTAPEAASTAPATTEEAGSAVTAGLWIEAVAVPPVGVCFFVSEDGTALTAGAECEVLEVEFEAVPGCPANGKLSIKGSGDTPIEGDKAVVTDANGTATVTFNSENSATVVAGSDSDPECSYTFENVTAGK
jgi:hypothetical protein